VVFVHGPGGSATNWGLVAPAIAARARTYALHLPGFGLSYPAGRSARVQANAEVVHRFVTEVVGEPAILVGNSMGGLISMMCATAHPGSVRSLALVDPVLPRVRGARQDPLVALVFAVYATPGVGERFLARRWARMTPEKLVAQSLELVVADMGALPADFVETSVTLARTRMTDAREGRATGLAASFLQAARSLIGVATRPTALRAMMRGIDVPVLLMHGAKDRLVPVRAARAAAEWCPQWRYEEFAGVGHCPMMEAPQMVAPLIGEWIEANVAAPGQSAETTGRS
jgi:pimeloyl-ACP methyl ester carboxylesterase